jgi:8-oxo-dGTP pyrophosphatase MutT (NUDIX family)
MSAVRKQFARVLVVNQSGRVLAVRHSGEHTSHYCFPGGKVEEAEKPKAAASRELYEELGIKVSKRKLRHCLTAEFDFGGEVWTGFFYICTYTGKRPTVMEYPKILSARFYSIAALCVLPGDVKSFTDVARHSKRKIWSTYAHIAGIRPRG